MAENTVNNEKNLSSQSSQLEEEDLQTLEADSEKTACSGSMAGGEVHVSFAALSQTHSVRQLCQTVSLAIVLLISTLTNSLCRTFLSCLS